MLGPDIGIGQRTEVERLKRELLKMEVGQKYQQALAENKGDPRTVLDEIKRFFVMIKVQIQHVVDAITKPFRESKHALPPQLQGVIDDKKSEVYKNAIVAQHAQTVLATYNEHPEVFAGLPNEGRRVIHWLSKKVGPEDLESDTSGAASLVSRIIGKALADQIKNPLADALDTQELTALQKANPVLFNRVCGALLQAATDVNVPVEDRKRFEAKVTEDLTVAHQADDGEGGTGAGAGGTGEGGGDGDDDGRRRDEGGGGGGNGAGTEGDEGESRPEDFEEVPTKGYEFNYLWKRFPDRDSRELLAALLKGKNFRNYITGEGPLEIEPQRNEAGRIMEDADGNVIYRTMEIRRPLLRDPRLRKKAIEEAGTDSGDAFNRELEIQVSGEFSNRVVNLIGRLYQQIDEARQEEFWEEEERKGGIWSSIQVLSEYLLTQLLTNLSNDPELQQAPFMDFYQKEQESHDIQMKAQPYFKVSEHGHSKVKDADLPDFWTKETELLSEPFFKDVKSKSFHAYIQAVRARAEAQIQIRKALHNAVALIYQPPPEGGYPRQLQNYVGRFLTANFLDNLIDQPDAEVMYAASALEDKFAEADHAKYNWIWQQEMNAPSLSKKLPERSVKVGDYLEKLFKARDEWPEGEQEWRLIRALRMALGDAYAISMRSFEYGARAVPPKEVRMGSTADFASWGPRDHKPYMAFYPQAHYNLRFSSDSTLWGNLLFLPVEGTNLGKPIWGSWDHNKLMQEMKNSLNEYQAGRTPRDAENGTMRLIDWINPAGVGSIYTRDWWRIWHAYEPYIELRREDVNITESFIAVENLGIEVMKDFLTHRIGGLNGQFYENKDMKPEDVIEARARRQEFVTYLVNKYFADEDATADNVFGDLESGKLGYDTFYYRVLTRAVKRRIPTKFLRYESNNQVVDRQRAWKEVREKAKARILKIARLKGTPEDIDDAYGEIYETAVRDIATAEVNLRMDTTEKLKKIYKRVKKDGRKLFQLKDEERGDIERIGNDYELTRGRLETHLNAMYAEAEPAERQRIQNALVVYDELQNFINRPDEIVGEHRNGKPRKTNYLDAFAARYEDGLPFALATEELERTLLAHRAIGQRGPERAFDDIANTEQSFNQFFIKYFKTLQHVSTDGKKDFHPLLELLESVHEQLEIDVGEELANKFVHHMAAVTLRFFMKDTQARGLIGNILSYGRANSVAAEFAGTLRNVWEWETNDANAWVNALEAVHLLPKHPRELTRDHIERHRIDFKIPFINKRIQALPVYEKAFGGWSGDRLRAEFGVTGYQVAWELLWKYGPIIALFLLYRWITQALEEEKEK